MGKVIYMKPKPVTKPKAVRVKRIESEPAVKIITKITYVEGPETPTYTEPGSPIDWSRMWPPKKGS